MHKQRTQDSRAKVNRRRGRNRMDSRQANQGHNLHNKDSRRRIRGR